MKRPSEAARGRRLHALACACLSVAALLASTATATPAAAAACPDARDRDADYLCPDGPGFTIPAFSDPAGWDEPSHFGTIMYGDLLGSGADELVARGIAGIEVYRFRPDAGQWSQVAVPPILPDRDGWNRPSRYRALALGDIDGDGRDELIARTRGGVVPFRYEQGSTPDRGRWTQLADAGPFPDLPDGSSDDPARFLSIELVPLGADPDRPTMQLLARGPNGLGLWRWDGRRWVAAAIALQDLSDRKGFDRPELWGTITAWDRERLLVRAADGIRVYRFVRPRRDDQLGRWVLESTRGPCALTPPAGSFPCRWDTIELARGVPGAGDDIVLVVLDERPGYGLRVARYDVERRTWRVADQQGNPWAEAVHQRPQHRHTLQLADVDGDGADELLGRGEHGIVVRELHFDARGDAVWGPQESLGRPELDGAAWDRRSSYETIATARLRSGTRARSLLARGLHGMRTWHFDPRTRSFERPRPYGAFERLDERALARAADYLGIARGGVRDVFAAPGSDPSAARLQSLQESLARTCSGAESAAPPRFARCTAPAGGERIADAVWTETANRLIAELFWARHVVDHFDALDDVQRRLFLDQNAEFPSLAGDLRLAGPEVRARLDTNAVFETVVQLIIGAEVPYVSSGLGAVGGLLALAAAFTPQATGDAPSEIEVTTTRLQREIAQVQQELSDAITRQRRYVLGDPGLTATVGRLFNSGIWQLDRQAALSAGRQGFTREVYEAFLPVLWDRWEVDRCVSELLGPSCRAPQPGPLMTVTAPRSPQSRDFTGLLPRQQPCSDADFGNVIFGSNRTCTFVALEQHGFAATVRTLLDPISDACRYDPVAQTSWRYGCSLGVPARALLEPAARSPWRFRVRRCDYLAYRDPRRSCHVAQE